jgi:PiT family inorganic phosphate transporter
MLSAQFAALAALALWLAWANGANDTAKGVATLVGAGLIDARRALVWASAATVAGGLCGGLWGAALIAQFSQGYVGDGIVVDAGFVAAVLLAAAGWVMFATRAGLPVSTTHALLGGVVGAALALGGLAGVATGAVAHKALAPLLFAPVAALLLCAALIAATQWLQRRVPRWRDGCCDPADWRANPYVCAPEAASPPVAALGRRLARLHWGSALAVSFARGLNDVPKIAAFVLLAAGFVQFAAPATGAVATRAASLAPAFAASLAVSLAMGAGGYLGGRRILAVLANRVARLDSASGLAANLGTSALVLAATPLGLPVSTTHVSTGALVGVRWRCNARPAAGDALAAILFGWVVTLPVAALVAAAVVKASALAVAPVVNLATFATQFFTGA